ncbi:benzoyl-CoA reductase/2-hydroxyglutaryl-CoA dehydratase subunit BcrC/BadD/HgdB [Paenibacillus forsythiae]|uniref:Benzoyl-CoA reductase/2-hydroxyglutaryl-CoA dehydratase subunit BcrC/BadD/HgdB n=1 Tax=Paenibacillus forsythiae TaxID=365616 RepID=A0ABU3H6E9_9BACL|nr:2-hydroxyacyl-CoA dehydratase family protein [Paenibacillus forsythiae]MDT3426400.1 benzoyl-CoA reductase/2-hydroxyglutaryl-CoA dehydratase subunit BcrC/BadD/HgdB [Paenibacillus forsythiae]
MSTVLTSEAQEQLNHIRHSRDVVHAYSPAIRKLFNLVIDYVDDAEKAGHSGKKVIWAGVPWAMPLIYSTGAIPVAFSEMGRISGQEAITISEDHYQMPAETCSMVKATAGEWYLRKQAGSSITRIFGSSSACEPYNLAWEVMKKEGFDVYTSDVVYRAPGVNGERYEELVHYFVDEIREFNEWLTGTREIDKDSLKREILRKNYLMRRIREIMDLRLNHPFYVKSLAIMYLLNGLTHYFGKPEEYTEVLDSLVEELSRLEANVADQGRAIPLIWTGGSGQEFGIYDAIDHAGGALLGFVSSPYAKDYNEDIDPVESLARFQLDSQMAGASIYRRHVIEQQIDKIGARGLILYGYLGCSFGSVTREMYREYFHNKGIPSINLEGTFQVGPPSGQILTRIRAFIEMLS